MNTNMNIPAGCALCPKCAGTGIGEELSPEEQKYTWNKDKTHHMCRNCGGQTMMAKPLGYTRIDQSTGLGCAHTFVGQHAGRCYTVYSCTKCGSGYDIDSGD